MSAVTSPSAAGAQQQNLQQQQEQSQQTYDFKILNQFSSELMHTYINIVFNYIVGLPTFQTAEAEAKLAQFIADNGLKPIYETLFYQLVSTLHNNIKHQHSPDYIEKSLTTTCNLSPDNSAIVKKSYSHNMQIVTQLFNENIFKVSRLLDIEWRFGVTTSNSQLAQVGTCWLQLKIKRAVQKKTNDGDAKQSDNNIDKNANDSGMKVEYDIIEMSLQQFYSFLTMLQEASAQMEQQ